MRLDRFWLLHKNVDRLVSEDGIRSLRISSATAMAAASGESKAISEAYEALNKVLGPIAVYDEGKRAMREAHAERNVAGLMKLQSEQHLTPGAKR